MVWRARRLYTHLVHEPVGALKLPSVRSSGHYRILLGVEEYLELELRVVVGMRHIAIHVTRK